MNIVGLNGSVKTTGIFKKMFQSHGHNFYLCSIENKNILSNVDAFLQTNIKKFYETNPIIIKSYDYIKKSNKPSFVIESPIFRMLAAESNKHERWHRLTVNSYFFNEGVYPKNMPSDRFTAMQKKYKIDIKDWQTSGSNILILLQKITDSSLNNLYKKHNTTTPIEGYCHWIEETIYNIRKHSDRKIVLRPHPNTTTAQIKYILQKIKKFDNCSVSENIVYNSSVTLSPSQDLEKDISNSFCVITFNSLSSVYSVLQGVPTYVLDPSSVAWNVTRNNLSLLEKPWEDIPRLQWLYDMSYCQWQGKEISKGIPLSIYKEHNVINL